MNEAVQINQSPLTYIVPVLKNDVIVHCDAKSNLTVRTEQDNGKHSYMKSGKTALTSELKAATYIISDQPASCIYTHDSVSTTIPPVSHYTNYYRFLTPSLANFSHHAVIIIESFELKGIRLDNSIPTVEKQETVVVDYQPYTVLYINVSLGQHEITHMKPAVNFGVILYGIGNKYGIDYAYPGGMRFG